MSDIVYWDDLDRQEQSWVLTDALKEYDFTGDDLDLAFTVRNDFEVNGSLFARHCSLGVWSDPLFMIFPHWQR